MQKLLNPVGFLKQTEYRDYEGITPEGKIKDLKLATESQSLKSTKEEIYGASVNADSLKEQE